MKKPIIILISCMLICFISCNNDRKPPFNKHLIKNLSEAQINFPSSYSGIIFFCKSQNNRILPLNANEFREIYSKEFSNMDYKLFLTRLLNQEIAIQQNKNKSFEINKNIERYYKTMGIGDFILFYCIKTSPNRYTLKRNIPKEMRNTVFYFLFINNYQTSFDDYGGMYAISKIE